MRLMIISIGCFLKFAIVSVTPLPLCQCYHTFHSGKLTAHRTHRGHRNAHHLFTMFYSLVRLTFTLHWIVSLFAWPALIMFRGHEARTQGAMQHSYSNMLFFAFTKDVISCCAIYILFELVIIKKNRNVKITFVL